MFQDDAFQSDAFQGTLAAAIASGCLTKAEWTEALAAIRPRGEAWRNGDFDMLSGSVMGQFFGAAASRFAATDARLCALMQEFFCSSADETRDIWRLEYGLPDGCDPFIEACEKANAVGDSTTAYAISVARRRGWSISIAEEFITASQDACYGPRCYGEAIYGARQGVLWAVTVDLADSTSYTAVSERLPLYGIHLYGDPLNCLPDIEPLRCLIRRIAPAHADLTFTTIN